MINKSNARLRRARKTRSRVRLMDVHRLTVFRSSKHIYAQVFLNNGSEVVTSASTNESVIREKNNSNINNVPIIPVSDEDNDIKSDTEVVQATSSSINNVA